MSFVDKITVAYTGNGNAVSSLAGSYTGDADAGLDTTIAASTTNQEFDIKFPHATIQSLVVFSSLDLTLLTNSTSMPGNTLNLKAGVGVYWGQDWAGDCPFTADVTKIYVTNASGTTASSLKIRVLYNL
jgi:hypothetical protein